MEPVNNNICSMQGICHLDTLIKKYTTKTAYIQYQINIKLVKKIYITNKT